MTWVVFVISIAKGGEIRLHDALADGWISPQVEWQRRMVFDRYD
jgi:hypothetical protein